MHRASSDNPLTTLGEAIWRHRRERFGIKREDRRKPMYILGKTGMGKSTLLANLVVSDIRAGEGVAVIDPHGPLVDDILDAIPDERVEEVIYINAADTKRPVPLNPLEHVDPAYHGLIASGIIATLKKMWKDSWGPRLEHILRYTILTLLAYPDTTLLDVTRLLTDDPWRKRVVATLRDPYLRNFWYQEFGAYAKAFRNEAIAPILNKVGQFVASPLMRGIVGHAESSFDVRQAMDAGKILLVNVAKGRIGEDASSLLSALMVTKIWLAALGRQNVPEQQRRDFFLTVDEAHASASFAEMLAEARKYRLNLTLAHQYLDQLDPDLRTAVLGNVGTLITFRTGAEDAAYLAREFYPVFDEADFVNLPQYHVYLKLLIDGVPSKGFSAVTLPSIGGKTGNTERVIALSRQRYGRLPAEGRQELFTSLHNL
jgi:hypothetical protein